MTAVAGSLAGEAGQPRRLARRHVWLVPGLGLAFLASAAANADDLGLAPLLVFGLVPHLTVLVGLGQPHGKGQVASRAVPLFNAMHRPIAPLAVIGLAAVGVLPPFWLAGGLAWLGHVLVDRAMGDGPRTPDGFRPAPRSGTAGVRRGSEAASLDPLAVA